MRSYREVTTKDSGLFETCARHTTRHTSRLLQTAFFCDRCTRKLVREAFNGRPPVFHGNTIEAYCGLCNKRRTVTLRQWFVCGPCWNVVLGFQKSVAASAALQAWWAEEISSEFPSLFLTETEPMMLSPYVRRTGTKLQRAASLAVLDFEVCASTNGRRRRLFHIEQKTGPGSINEMGSFQLDVNDYNDIAGATNFTKTPSYIVHVQAVRKYLFPTSRTVVKGMWWTDIFMLRAHQSHIAQRRGEDKRAIYYDPEVFRPISTFPAILAAAEYKRLAAKLKTKKIKLIR